MHLAFHFREYAFEINESLFILFYFIEFIQYDIYENYYIYKL